MFLLILELLLLLVLAHLFSEVSRNVDSFGALILRVVVCGLGRLATPAGRVMIFVVERLRWFLLLLLLKVAIDVLALDHHLLVSEYVATVVTTITSSIKQELLFAGEVAGEERAAMLKGLILGSHDDQVSITAPLLLLLLALNFLLYFLGHRRCRYRHRRGHLCPESRHQAGGGGHDSRSLASAAAAPYRRFRFSIPWLYLDLQDLLVLFSLKRFAVVCRCVHGRSGVVSPLKDHWLSFNSIGITHLIIDHCSLLQVVNHFEDALFRKSGRLFLSVPVRDLSTQINSHDLLDVGPNHLEVFVVDRAHPNEVDIDDADDVAPHQPRMFLHKLFVPEARADELVLAGLTPLNLVVRVDEGTVGYH